MKHILKMILLTGLLSQLPAIAEQDHEHNHNHEHVDDHDAHSGIDVKGKKQDGEEGHHVNGTDKDKDGHNHDESHDHESHDDEGANGHADELSTRIEAIMASQVGIETAIVSSQALHQSVIAYGDLSTGPEQLSHVRARYTGMIKSVKATLGDKVKRGDLLAEVESNDSLKVYKIKSPITGSIVQRHANAGEVTQDQVLFSIANFDILWAELRIYPAQQILVKPGQAVRIRLYGQLLQGTIRHIIPVLDKPYQLARVDFDNRNRGLTPGLLVEGHVEVGTFNAGLAVVKDAIQSMGGQQGVFIKQGDEYQFTPVQTGRADDRYMEVLFGLSQGQEYVSKNSYLIKADIEKSEAEHDH